VQLDGGESSDADGSIVRYNWSQTRGPSVELQGRRSATPSFTMPANAELAFTLAVIDDAGSVSRDSVLIRSTATTNQAPIANAGADQTRDAGVTVQLDGGESSDADGSIVRYNWYQHRGPSVELQNRRSATPSFTMPSNAELAFILAVVDDSGSISRDSVLIHSTVNTNQAPTASAGADQRSNAGDLVQLDGSGSSDVDGTITKFIWRQLSGPSIELDNRNSVSPSFDATEPGEIVLRLYVEDDNGSRSFDEVRVSVNDTTSLSPIAVAGEDGEGVEGSVFLVDAQQSSAAVGEISSYQWEQVSGPAASVYSGGLDRVRVSLLLPEIDGDTPITFRLTVTDDQGLTSTDDIIIQVLEYLPPEPVPFPEQTVVEGDYYVMDTTDLFSVQPGLRIALESRRWSQLSGPPVALQYKKYRAQARILAPEVDASTQLVFEITATDTRGTLARNTITLNIIRGEDMPENILPQANAGEDRVSISNQFIVVDGSASTDLDGEIVSYDWELIDTTNSSANVSVFSSHYGPNHYPTSSAVVLPGCPGCGDTVAGEYTVRLTVTDDRGGTATDDVVITLNADVNIGESPAADAGSNARTWPYYFNYDEPLRLDSSGSSDSDGRIEAVYWQQVKGPKVDVNGSRFIPAQIQGVVGYEFLLTVVDDQGNQGNDRMRWSVHYKNSRPVANFAKPRVVALTGTKFQLDASAS
jgi:hypothetical protein